VAMGRANRSRECAPDDKLSDTHQLQFAGVMGFARGSARPTDLPDGLFGECRVKASLQKYSAFPNTQIASIFPAVPSHRGALRNVTKRGSGCGGRW
jgi:hypothetical protein